MVLLIVLFYPWYIMIPSVWKQDLLVSDVTVCLSSQTFYRGMV